jgi:preprotein translocase subunit SecD
VASAALLYYALVLFAVFRLIPVTLTLAGIAGFVLSVGMAVDANILIFERSKEELRLGKSLPQAIEAGFARAWNSILDSNVSSLITAPSCTPGSSSSGLSLVRSSACCSDVRAIVTRTICAGREWGPAVRPTSDALPLAPGYRPRRLAGALTSSEESGFSFVC